MNQCIGLLYFTIINLMSMSNKIYINGRFLTQKLSGVQRHAFELSKHLSEIDKNKVILLVPSKSVIRREYYYKFNILSFGINTGHLWEQIDLPFFLLKKKKAILINFTNSSPVLFKNKISTIHDLSVIENKDWFSFTYRFFYKNFIPLFLKTSKRIFTDSYFSKNQLIKRYKLKSELIDVIYCASSIKKNKLIKDEKSEKFILFIGGSSKRKNLKNLVKAFTLIDTRIKLKIVGKFTDNINSDYILENDRIEFLDSVSNDLLEYLYTNAIMLVFPSFYEGFGLPPLEAMSCGCPVVASNIPVLKEVYDDSILYFDPYNIDSIKDTITKVLYDKKLRKIMIEKGLEKTEKYSWENSANKIFNLITNKI